METARMAGELFRAVTPQGRVHVARSGRFGGVVLDCSGRTVSVAMPTDERVSCRACERRHAGNVTVLGGEIDG